MPFGYKEIPLEQVVANSYTASPQEIHDGIVLYRVNDTKWSRYSPTVLSTTPLVPAPPCDDISMPSPWAQLLPSSQGCHSHPLHSASFRHIFPHTPVST